MGWCQGRKQFQISLLLDKIKSKITNVLVFHEHVLDTGNAVTKYYNAIINFSVIFKCTRFLLQCPNTSNTLFIFIDKLTHDHDIWGNQLSCTLYFKDLFITTHWYTIYLTIRIFRITGSLPFLPVLLMSPHHQNLPASKW